MRSLAVARARATARLSGWLRSLPERAPEILRVSAACTASWYVASVVTSTLPVLAPLATLTTVRRTAYRSVREGMSQAVGVVAGAVAALAAGVVVGVHVWTVGLVVLVALALSMRSTGTQAATTSLLVLALGVTYGRVRVEALLIGAAVGVLVSVLTPVSLRPRATDELAGLAADMGRLLAEVARGVGVPFGEAQAQAWLQQARGLTDRLRAAEAATRDARESVRWTPWRLTGDEAADAGEAFTALDHVVGQVRAIARAVADLAAEHAHRHGDDQPWLDPVVRDRLTAAAATLEAFAAALRDESEVERLRTAVATHRTEPGRPAPGAPPEVDRAQVTLLAETGRILGEVDPAGAHPPWRREPAAA